MSITTITKLKPEGPTPSSVAELPPIPAQALMSGDPVQKGFRYYEETESGFRAGIWACTAFQSKVEPHAVYEFMHLLEGTVTIVHEDGSELVVNQGEQFFIPKGTVKSWKQTGPVRKYYMIFPDPSGPEPQDSASLRAFKIKPKASGESASGASSIYEDPTGRYSIGVWHPAAEGRRPEPLDATEMLIPLDNTLTLIDGNGETAVAPGEVVLVPAGAQFGWTESKPASVIYCAFKKS
jgi:uncharacterized cupin superfamily protein